MRLLLCLSVIIMMTGCSSIRQTQPSQSPYELWQQRQLQQAELQAWAFKGRTAIVQGQEGWNAGINWQEQGQHYQIRLSGPFSQGGVSLDGDQQQVTLTLNDGETLTAPTPEQLLAEAMGWLLPVSALRDWVRGVPYSGAPVDSRELDQEGRLTKLEQAGWQIEFLRYMPFESYSMPAKVFMKHARLNVKLIVSDWSRP
ncbi:lipoprotein insertase outer membrane protein LolB [uncultured Methylophaga sp.]|uniref:lipoprotein insertase outer membrane protein LolB n=1 Tax=uncultured Methylophaga sp. TaxID=285271 RepID=UPI002607D035|nr:lipoprotein insertase outer membrane protein LolB [uncultured Methylophaga sp.]